MKINNLLIAYEKKYEEERARHENAMKVLEEVKAGYRKIEKEIADVVRRKKTLNQYINGILHDPENRWENVKGLVVKTVDNPYTYTVVTTGAGFFIFGPMGALGGLLVGSGGYGARKLIGSKVLKTKGNVIDLVGITEESYKKLDNYLFSDKGVMEQAKILAEQIVNWNNYSIKASQEKSQLEERITILKKEEKKLEDGYDKKYGKIDDSVLPQEALSLRKEINEKEKKIMEDEFKVTRLEHELMDNELSMRGDRAVLMGLMVYYSPLNKLYTKMKKIIARKETSIKSLSELTKGVDLFLENSENVNTLEKYFNRLLDEASKQAEKIRRVADDAIPKNIYRLETVEKAEKDFGKELKKMLETNDDPQTQQFMKNILGPISEDKTKQLQK